MNVQNRLIDIEVSKILLKNTKQVFFVSLITPILFTLSLEIINEKSSFFWMAFVVIGTFLRYFIIRNIEFGDRFLFFFRFTLFVICSTWGLGALSFIQHYPSKKTLILLYLVGYCGAALPTIAACQWSIKILFFCILSPVICHILLSLNSSIFPAFCAILFFLIISIKSGAKISQDIHTKISTQVYLEEQLELNKTIALTDDLTKIHNRRFFNHKMDIISKEKLNYPIFLLILDIDHFKKINDNFGHDIGDIVLAKTAEIISSILPNFSYFSRIGGEEFGIIVKNMLYSEVVELAEEIILKISGHKFDITSDDPPFFVTLSIGISMTHAPENIHKVFKLADLALYEAKKQGRNRVIWGSSI